MAIRIVSTLLVLAQLLVLAAPAQAQGYRNFWPSPGTLGYYNGTGGVYVPRGLITPQYGYSAASRYGYPSNGMGMAIGLGMYGGMMGIGTMMMASQMIARHSLNKKNSQSQNGGRQNPSPKDKAAKADRRRNQELKIKGELDADYQKELAEKGMIPASGPMPGGAPGSLPGGAPGGFPAGAPGGFQGGTSGFNPPQAVAPAFGQNTPAMAPMGMSQTPAMSQPPTMSPPPAGFPGGNGVLNPTPWTPTGE